MAVEGLVILGIGVYMVWDAVDARDITRQLIAAMLLINSIVLVVDGLRNRLHRTSVLQAMRGGIGLATGAVVILANWSDYLPDDAARYILGFGLLAYGALGSWIPFLAARGEDDLKFSGFVTAGLTIVLAVVLLTGGEKTGEDRIRLLGAIAILIGLALLGYAAWMRRSADEPATPADR